MRFAVFVFSLYLIFAQMHSAYAWLPLAGGAVATARGFGTVIKGGRVIKGAIAAGAVAKWCKSNKKCKELAGEAAELILGDDDDDENATCRYRFAINTNDTPKSASETYSEILSRLAQDNPYFEYKSHPKHNEQINMFIKEHKQFVKEYPSSVNKDDYWHVVRLDNTYYFQRYKNSENETYFESPHSIAMFANCHEGDIDNSYSPDDEEKKKREKELYDALKDKLSDDEITNIVNNYGDDIDIDKYCTSGATCYFIDNDFEKEINNNDYDIDKVNEQNCNMKNGKISSCPNANRKKDKDDKNESGDTRKDDEKDKDGLNVPKIPNFTVPVFCEWAKPVCDFVEWFQDKPPKPDEPKTVQKANLSDVGLDDSMINKQYVNFGGSCPSHQLSFTVKGLTVNQPIPTHHFCRLLENIAPFLLAFTWLGSAMMILRSI